MKGIKPDMIIEDEVTTKNEAEFSIHPEDLEALVEKHEDGFNLEREEISTLIKTMRMFYKKMQHWELEAARLSRLLKEK